MQWNPDLNYRANVQTGMWIPVVATIASVDYPVYARFGGVDDVFKDGNSQHTDYELEFRTNDLLGFNVGHAVTINGDAYAVKTAPAFSDESEYFSTCGLQRESRSYPKRAIDFPSAGSVPGLPAPPIIAPGNAFLNRIAAVSLGGHRIVRAVNGIEVDYADNTVEAHGDVLLGISLNAATAGAPVRVQTEGELEHGGWSWVPEQPIWLGTNGLPTQTPPDSPVARFSVRIAFAMTATKIFIEIEEPVFLE